MMLLERLLVALLPWAFLLLWLPLQLKSMLSVFLI